MLNTKGRYVSNGYTLAGPGTTIQRAVPKQHLTKQQRRAIRAVQKEQKKNDTFDWLADAKERGNQVSQEVSYDDQK
jgi:hypothetical protein